jgi:hypothetical protein
MRSCVRSADQASRPGNRRSALRPTAFEMRRTCGLSCLPVLPRPGVALPRPGSVQMTLIPKRSFVTSVVQDQPARYAERPVAGRQAGRAPLRANASTKGAYPSRSGCVAKLCTADVVAHGRFSEVKTSTKGAYQWCSSSMVARTLTKKSRPWACVNIQFLQCGQ